MKRLLLVSVGTGAVAVMAILAIQEPQARTTDATSSPKAVAASIPFNSDRNAYYGDLHLHTSYSLDAYAVGSAVEPSAAYRFAAGYPVDYLGEKAVRGQPLDFMAVTDHSEYLNVLRSMDDPRTSVHQSPDGRSAFLKALFPRWGMPGKSLVTKDMEAISKSAWQREIEAANQAYRPGKFTTFVAYEWTAGQGEAGFHRNVIFRGSSAPDPFSFLDSNRPEDLWAWLDAIRKRGYEALAIPHNGNVSNGLMYDWVTSDGNPINDIYARDRQRNEPLSEISQSKGQSETHPLLSPTDEFANFELMETWGGVPVANYKPGGSYVRDALGRGLMLGDKLGVNPFKYGMVGASDIHTGLSTSSERSWNGNFWQANLGGGKISRNEIAKVLNGSAITLNGPGTTAGSLTGVWAEQNTRESIYAALRRKETFATSGTRLKLRFFGGWDFDNGLLRSRDWVKTAYRTGVPMGGDLPSVNGRERAPSFAIQAVKDPDGANLDRLQVVKVWLEDGKQKERLYNVALSNGRRVDPNTGKAPAVGNTVDLQTATYTNTIGATELKTVWRDPHFDPAQAAVYYLRVLEIPTPRWTVIQAVKASVAPPKAVPTAIQERGWSSPIWYTPATGRGGMPGPAGSAR